MKIDENENRNENENRKGSQKSSISHVFLSKQIRYMLKQTLMIRKTSAVMFRMFPPMSIRAFPEESTLVVTSLS